jgi:hypothetical protein
MSLKFALIIVDNQMFAGCRNLASEGPSAQRDPLVCNSWTASRYFEISAYLYQERSYENGMYKIIATLAILALTSLARAQEVTMIQSRDVTYSTDDEGNRLTIYTFYRDYSCDGRTKRDTDTQILTTYRRKLAYGRDITPEDTSVYVTKSGEWSKPFVRVEEPDKKAPPIAPQAPVTVTTMSAAEIHAASLAGAARVKAEAAADAAQHKTKHFMKGE